MSIAASAPHKQAPFSKIVSAVASARTQLRAGASLNSVIRPALLNVPQESRPAAQALIYESVRRCARTTALVGLLCSRQPSAEVLSVLETAFAAFSLGRLAVFTVVSETVTAAKANPQTRAASGFINAVLRRYLREKDELERRSPPATRSASMLPLGGSAASARFIRRMRTAFWSWARVILR